MLTAVRHSYNANFSGKPSFGARISIPVNMPQNIVENILNGTISKHFVPTTSNVIEQMVRFLDPIRSSDKILEPSAGYGHIADKLVSISNIRPNQVDVIEPIEAFRRTLHSKGYNLVGFDVLKYKPDYLYDKIIMNPPFDNGSDILHLLHCFNLLRPSGRLVAILPENDFIPKRQPGYEKWMKDWLGTGEKKEINEYLDDVLNSNDSKVIKLGKVFKESDVPDDVETRMVIINKK